MAILECEDLSFGYDGETVLEGVNFALSAGDYLCVVGENGSGKSTLIKGLLGLKAPDRGSIRFGDGLLSTEIGYLPQQTQIQRDFPASVREVVLSGCLNSLGRRLHYNADDRQRAAMNLERMGIEDLADKSYHELSGGQQQRVALARALVIEPSVLLFDEPLSNLDAKLRVSMRTEIRRIQQEVGITAIYVTHDQSEAMALSDKIIIMDKGYVAQMGTPQEIYYHPVNEFVADFIGEANFLKGSLKRMDGSLAVLDVEGSECPVAANDGMETGKEYTVVLRPEAATLADEGGLPCRVILSCFMGSYQNYHVMVGDTLVKLAEHNPKNKRIYEVGEECRLVFDPESVHVL